MQDRELEQLRELQQRFGYMFRTPNLGLDVYRGWLPDFVIACERIDAVLGNDKLGFHFKQTKEKYGWARYYFSTDRANPMRLSIRDARGLHELTKGLGDEHDVEKTIAAILNDTEESSRGKCIVCGSTAEIRMIDGWLVCACDMHGPEKRGDHLNYALLRT